MRFDDFDKKMRAYEESLDQFVLPDMYIVVRLDGRGFTRMTKKRFEKPFDIRFREMMLQVTKELIENSGFKIIYGYTQSDEISLLFDPYENSFGRKVRKINSTLAGIASAKASMILGELVTFDCRVVPLPNMDRVKDYFLFYGVRQTLTETLLMAGVTGFFVRKESPEGKQQLFFPARAMPLRMSSCSKEVSTIMMYPPGRREALDFVMIRFIRPVSIPEPARQRKSAAMLLSIRRFFRLV